MSKPAAVRKYKRDEKMTPFICFLSKYLFRMCKPEFACLGNDRKVLQIQEIWQSGQSSANAEIKIFK